MGVSRWSEESAGDDSPDEWDGDGDGEPGLLGFVGVPDTPSGRHATPLERPRFGGRLAGLLSAAGLPVVALGVALLASLVAGVSLLVGMVAVSRVGNPVPAAERVAAGPSAPSATEVDPGAASQAVLPAPPVSSPSPSYLPVYTDQVLRVGRFTCEGTPVDLDEPRVLPIAGADLAYRTCEDGPHLDLDAAARFAVVDVPTATADDCLDAIRLNPSVGWLTPDENVTACVLTSPTAAAAQRISQKLVRLRVDSIDTNGTLLLSLAAWAVSNP
jgi:hypothetical protein